MAKLNSRKSTSAASTSAADIIIKKSSKQKKIPFFTEDVVPAGSYVSKIVGVADSRTDKGAAAVDVIHELVDTDGVTRVAKMRYPCKGYYLERLFDDLVAAGIPDGKPLSAAIGIEENVTVAYAYEGALGKFTSRKPLANNSKRRQGLASPAAVSGIDDEDSDDFAVDEEESFDDDTEFDDFFTEED